MKYVDLFLYMRILRWRIPRRSTHARPLCAIADEARVISDFRMMGDQRELFGPVASVPTAWRVLKESAPGGERTRRKVTAALNKERRHAWAQVGALPPVRVADRVLEGVTCIRLDATVVQAHSDKELAEANFKRLRASSFARGLR
jgi:hypothetical protein